MKNVAEMFLSLANVKGEKVKLLSNNLKISKTKKNNPTPRVNKRAIDYVSPWVDLEATLL